MAVFRVLGVRARTARLSASDRQPAPPVPPRARALLLLPAAPVKAARRVLQSQQRGLHDAAVLCGCWGELRVGTHTVGQQNKVESFARFARAARAPHRPKLFEVSRFTMIHTNHLPHM